MKRVLQSFTLVAVLSLSGCVTPQRVDEARYQSQLDKLSKKLRTEKQVTQNLKDENIVLRQLAGVPEPALQRVSRESKKYLGKVYSEKFLYEQVLRAFKKKDRVALDRSVNVFLTQYPKSSKCDNAVYLKGLLSLKEGNFAESLTQFDSLVEKFPKANKKPAAILGKGLAYQSLNINDQAELMFDTVIKGYPKSPEAIRARRELKKLRGQ